MKLDLATIHIWYLELIQSLLILKANKSTQVSNKLGALIPNYYENPGLNTTKNQKLNQSASPETPRRVDPNISNPQISQRSGLPVAQEKPRPNVLSSSGKYSILGNGIDLHYDPITNPIPLINKNPCNFQKVGVAGTRSITENMYKRAQNDNLSISMHL